MMRCVKSAKSRRYCLTLQRYDCATLCTINLHVNRITCRAQQYGLNDDNFIIFDCVKYYIRRRVKKKKNKPK